MSGKKLPLYFYYSWESLPDSLIPNILMEFKSNGADHIVFHQVWAKRILQEPSFFAPLMTMLRRSGLKMGAIHAPCGAAFDLNCSDMPRRKGMIEAHKTMMAYAADAGCKTYTIHVGSYSYVMEHVPLSRLRTLAALTLEQLLPEAEKLGLVIAVENSYEPPNAATEIVNLISKFDSSSLGCCFDTGHACLMAPFPGKERSRYFSEIDDAWWEGLQETADTFELMKPYIVTSHMHDNDGYRDAHDLPGRGRIDWKTQIEKLLSCPRLMSLQTEVQTFSTHLPVKTLVDTFHSLLS